MVCDTAAVSFQGHSYVNHFTIIPFGVYTCYSMSALAWLREALNGGTITVCRYVPVPVALRKIDNACGFPSGQLSCIFSEGSTVRDLQP